MFNIGIMISSHFVELKQGFCEHKRLSISHFEPVKFVLHTHSNCVRLLLLNLQFHTPQTPNSDQEEVRYGPFSDGEADRVTKRPVGPVGGLRGGRGRMRRQSTSSYCGTTTTTSSNVGGVGGVDFPPHYVTLSRATLDQVRYRKQNFTDRIVRLDCLPN